MALLFWYLGTQTVVLCCLNVGRTKVSVPRENEHQDTEAMGLKPCFYYVWPLKKIL